MAEIRRAKKTFNIISIALIDQMLTLFKEDATLQFLKSEIEKMAVDKKNDHVCAANYFKTMNIETKIPPSKDLGREEDDPVLGKVVVGELVIRMDDRLFGPDTGVAIPVIDQLGLKEKWPKLSEKNKQMVWDYLIRMAKAAAQVVIGTQMTNPEFMGTIQKSMSGVNVQPGMTEADFTKMAKQVGSLVQKQ
jgi:hypothetical protein